ncbi:unnamed protein product [Chironomus riparius]|uniref:Sodium/calcium exchanger membrane region domain-containing protein n=1 Tax=Chironomus riparius TaxID=315576 RepID=A0A9P0IZ94_9DIPT|nr:unnamed protein product [Chironomus riparius]
MMKISRYIRVFLLLITCFLYFLTRIFIINNGEEDEERIKRNRDDDKKSFVFTSSQRRLLSMSEHENGQDTNSIQSQHDLVTQNNNVRSDTIARPEELNYYGSQAVLELAIYESVQNGTNAVKKSSSRIIAHILVSCYCFWMLAIICDEYFMASIHVFCHKLKIKHELASGTFMTMATSMPELCISCVGTFISDGGIGIGTIVGSAIFNILVITACCGILTRSINKVDVYLLSRDCIFYALSIIGLIAVIYDHLIMWHEAALMVAGYGVYLTMMYSNDIMAEKTKLIARKLKIQFSMVSLQLYYAEDFNDDKVTEITPLFMRAESINIENHKYSKYKENIKLVVEYEKLDEDDEDCAINPWKLQRLSSLPLFILKWPITFILWCSIPDCRRYEKFFVITFINCVAWILCLSYLIASMIANVDSIMGIIFLGACTSIPEAVSSVIMNMKGNANMAINNAISSNIFDILLCLGLPWSVRTILIPLILGKPRITLASTGVTYSAISLLATLFVFVFLFIINRFKLDRKIGISCSIFYLVFLIFTFMLEMNLFIPMNFPSISAINGLI